MKFHIYLPGLCLAFFSLTGCWEEPGTLSSRAPVEITSSGISAEERIAQAYADRQSGFMAEAAGTVTKVLPDDDDEHPHQRFIIQISSGQTLLISHNIDLAPRVEDVKAGDSVEVFGQYEWNEKGGMIHWTHHDPQGKHAEGWILHHGRRYE